jgi:hypothetical protein
MSGTQEQRIKERLRAKAEYGQLFDDVAALLLRHDPININFNTNRDEYEPEVVTILPRLRSCASAEDVCRVVHEEFVGWFSAESAGPQEHYARIASEIWEHWQKFNAA